MLMHPHTHMHINRSQSGRLRMCPQRDGAAGEQGDGEVVEETQKEEWRRKRG